MSRTKKPHAINRQYSTELPKKEPKTPPLDKAMAFPRYSNKHNLTFYGETQAEADKKLDDYEKKNANRKPHNWWRAWNPKKQDIREK